MSSVSKKRKSNDKLKNGSITSYFTVKPSRTKEKEKDSRDESDDEREVKRRKIYSVSTRDFLASGVPDVVIRTQKLVEKKKEEDAFLSTVAFFPKLTSTIKAGLSESLLEKDDTVKESKFFRLKQSSVEDEDSDISFKETSCTKNFIWIEMEHEDDFNSQLCCPSLCSQLNLTKKKVLKLSDAKEGLPWIERFKVESYKDLVCDSTNLRNFAKWLKQWKTDIKDDGGASRKIVKRKRVKGSDSEFITSEDEHGEFKKKSVLLAGPPGCGKATAVYVTAKHYGFHVVEVNFSSRRPGKDVLQRVKEAVLSHRVESSSNCLLLFKDIDLIDDEEDEGFYAAVAQLITTAVRPIVMTTSKAIDFVLDSKLERKDPLKISFEYPKSPEIVDKVLMPMIKSRMKKKMSADALVSLESYLRSITLHARCDIRQVINQAQVLFACNRPITKEIIHQHSIQQNQFLDLGFIQSNKPYIDINNSNNSSDEESVCKSIKARKKRTQTDINSICESLEALGDLDFVDGINSRLRKPIYDEESSLPNEKLQLKSMYFNPVFKSKLESKPKDSRFRDILSKLTFESQEEVIKSEEIYKLGAKVGEYLELPGIDSSWELAACVRTIMKGNMMDSVGRNAKRNRRLTYYFDRLDKGFMDEICKTFNYDQELELAKLQNS